MARTDRTTRRTRRGVVLGALAAALVATLVTGSPADAVTCSTPWGSLAKVSTPMTTAPLRNVRAGRNACYDRLVVDLGAGRAPGYRVSYVSAVLTEGQGAVIPLRGGARLAVVALAPAYDGSGRPTYRPANPRELANVTGFTTFRQVAWGGTSEGQSTIGLGVRARLPFRVFTLHDTTGNRLVVDVAHRW